MIVFICKNIILIIYSLSRYLMATLQTKDPLIRITQQQFQRRYKYVEMIDQGSYGVVCKCEDLNTHKFVAAKYLKDEDGLDSFVKQFQIMSYFNHENILKSLGLYYIASKAQYVLVTTFCDKENLKKCLPQIKQETQQLKIWICVQLARAIDALHQRNIMHRDIKPANVLINKNWNIKLCDFGFGRDDLSGMKTIKIGTPLYRDPNVVSGNYTKKCDIYSAGLVFDTIFRGKSLYEGVSPQKFPLEQIWFVNNKRQVISKLPCCNQMKQLILACLEKEEIKRIDSHTLVNKIQQIYSKFQPTFNNSKENQSKILASEEKNKQKFQKLIKQVQMANPAFEKRGTEIYVNQSQFQEKQLTKSHRISIDFLSISPILSKQLKTKKHPEIQYNNFYLKLIKTRKEISEQEKRNGNSGKIINYLLGRQKKLRQIQQLQKVKNMPCRDKKILIYIAVYGYLRMLKMTKLFLANGNNGSAIESIEGVRKQQISQKTVQICMRFIGQETDMMKEIIKPTLVGLHNANKFYKEVITNAVLNMINDGYQNKFTRIEEFDVSQIRKQFLSLLFHPRYEGTNCQLEQLKLQLKTIVQYIF